MENHYNYGGIVVSSEFELEGLDRAMVHRGQETLLTMQVKPFPGGPLPERKHLYSWKGLFRLVLSETGRGFIFGCGTEFEFHYDVGTCTAFWHSPGGTFDARHAEFFIRRVLPRIAILLGRTVIHSSAVSTPFGAVLFVGPSGSGKSTLARRLSDQSHWGLLSDDTAVLFIGASNTTVFPAENTVCLHEDSLKAFASGPERGSNQSYYSAKYRRSVQSEKIRVPQILRAIYFLQRGTEAKRIESFPISAKATVSLAYSQLICVNPKDQQQRFLHFPLLTLLPSMVMNRTLEYPRDFGDLHNLVQFITGELSEGSRAP
jgi:hypothetical protein